MKPGHLPEDLILLLVMAVEVDLAEVRAMPPSRLRLCVEETADNVAAAADHLVRSTEGIRPRTKAQREEWMIAWKALVRALAIGSLARYGMEFGGRHWHADHRPCLTGRLAAAMRRLVEARS